MGNFILCAVHYLVEQSGFDNTISRLNVSKTNLWKICKTDKYIIHICFNSNKSEKYFTIIKLGFSWLHN